MEAAGIKGHPHRLGRPQTLTLWTLTLGTPWRITLGPHGNAPGGGVGVGWDANVYWNYTSKNTWACLPPHFQHPVSTHFQHRLTSNIQTSLPWGDRSTFIITWLNHLGFVCGGGIRDHSTYRIIGIIAAIRHLRFPLGGGILLLTELLDSSI